MDCIFGFWKFDPWADLGLLQTQIAAKTSHFASCFGHLAVKPRHFFCVGCITCARFQQNRNGGNPLRFGLVVFGMVCIFGTPPKLLQRISSQKLWKLFMSHQTLAGAVNLLDIEGCIFRIQKFGPRADLGLLPAEIAAKNRCFGPFLAGSTSGFLYFFFVGCIKCK